MAREAGKQKKKELSFAIMMIMEDGRTVPFGELSEEERARWRENAAARLSERMSDYYTQHPEEAARLP